MDYELRVVALYEGEMYGERLFSMLADRETDAEVARMWRSVAEVERLTGASIKPLAARFDGRLERQRELGEARARAQFAAFEGQSWQDLLEHYRDRVPNSQAKLRELEALAPPSDAAALRQFVEHSQAFGHCVNRWLGGDREGALAALNDYLAAYA